jgi:hypothetical protein
MGSSSNSGKKRFDPSKIVTSGDDPTKAETKVKSDADAVGKVEAAPPADYTMPTDTQKAVEQQRPAPPVEMTSPRKGSMAAKYIEGLF